MTGFEPRTSSIGSDRSTNWTTQPLPIRERILISHEKFEIIDPIWFLTFSVFLKSTAQRNWIVKVYNLFLLIVLFLNKKRHI